MGLGNQMKETLLDLNLNTSLKYMYDNHTFMYDKHTPLGVPRSKILSIFLDMNRHYFAELTKLTKLTRPRTLRALRKLVLLEILETKTEANVKYYSLRKSPFLFAVLSMVEYNLTAIFLNKHNDLKRALDMFKEKYGDYLVLALFGSLVKGYAAKASDIDLLLIKEDFSKNDIKKVEDIIHIINGRTGLKISPYFMNVEEFKKKNELAKEIIEKHILIAGGELFFRMVLE